MRSALVVALAIPGAVLAGRPLDTEDATTLDDRACQLESWADRTRGDVTDFYFVPACTYSGVEWQAGAVRTREGGSSVTTSTFAQGKYAFRRVDDGAWGIGLVAGLLREPRRETKNGWGDPYFILPVSLGLGEDKATRGLVHLNVGTRRARHQARNVTLWGVAVEKPAGERLTLVAEAFGENAGKPFIRAGGRYTLFDRFDIDLTYVTRAGGVKEERRWSLGLHWQTAPFLP